MQLGFLTASRYQRAFVDFFEDQLVARQYNLQGLLDEYLLGGREPLINGIISGRPYKSTQLQSLLTVQQLRIPSSTSAMPTNSNRRPSQSKR